ncbi:hypothetical protein ACFOWB_14550 [Chenggangzhangella methanolivorans]
MDSMRTKMEQEPIDEAREIAAAIRELQARAKRAGLAMTAYMLEMAGLTAEEAARGGEK